VTHSPCGRLRDAQITSQENGRDALAGIDDQIDGLQLFPTGQLGTVHRCPGRDGKLAFTLIAFVQTRTDMQAFQGA
jgi:hypothetical protein